jgi:hypothetical protein
MKYRSGSEYRVFPAGASVSASPSTRRAMDASSSAPAVLAGGMVERIVLPVEDGWTVVPAGHEVRIADTSWDGRGQDLVLSPGTKFRRLSKGSPTALAEWEVHA